MPMKPARFIIPSLLVLLGGVPATAQIRIGVDFGPVSIRIAPDAPPPPRWERRSERPSESHIWIGGYWDRRDDQWAWAPGRWEEPAQQGSTWVEPRYIHEDGAYRYEPGRWSHQRMVEGDDYSRWHKEHGHGEGHEDRHDNGRHRGHHKDHDRDRGEGHGDQ